MSSEAASEEVQAIAAKEYTADDIQRQLKPLSENAFLRFFQNIWRWWLGVWYGFSAKHPKASGIIYKVFFFIIFSEGVTILQFLIMTFLPFAFESIWDMPFVWPAVALGLKDAGGNVLNYAIFNEPVKFLVMIDGKEQAVLASTTEQVKAYMALYGRDALQASGLGNFIAFEIAVFIAQCINFPLQRNITYRSHGNPWFQAMWYFIGWVLVSIATNALWGICNPLMMSWNWNEVVIGLIKTVITGGISMAVFFFIFMVIFPDNNAAAKRAKAKYAKMKESGANEEALAKVEAKMQAAEKAAALTNAEKDYVQASSIVNSKAMAYFAAVKAKETPKKDEDVSVLEERVSKSFTEAIEAIKTKEEKEAAFEAVKAAA